ncbi:hypothetical protein SAY87_000085 [Trapa incisa]|uniref:Uncharacterized protein n=1 Tax=Trapa incisa TaxID=236973 RepID=A0AAN7GI18_9MYRT|nr:hypothetical protein SAY87_000085 [Trapa incisa]
MIGFPSLSFLGCFHQGCFSPWDALSSRGFTTAVGIIRSLLATEMNQPGNAPKQEKKLVFNQSCSYMELLLMTLSANEIFSSIVMQNLDQYRQKITGEITA